MGKKIAVKKGGKLGPVVEKKVMPVEEDPQRLVNYVCGSNIYTKGEDIKVSSCRLITSSSWNINSFRSNQTTNILIGFGTSTSAHLRLSRSLIPIRRNTGASFDKWDLEEITKFKSLESSEKLN